MAKSKRSKWIKMHRRIKAENAKPIVAKVVKGLNDKLVLASQGKLHSVPMQERPKNFFFTSPKVDGPVQLEPIHARAKKANPKRLAGASTAGKKAVVKKGELLGQNKKGKNVSRPETADAKHEEKQQQKPQFLIGNEAALHAAAPLMPKHTMHTKHQKTLAPAFTAAEKKFSAVNDFPQPKKPQKKKKEK